jgi:threonine/homoserine/homoserine lactone efflux protein
MIPFATLLALVLFALVCAITPGPNNFIATSAGLSFGFRRSLAHVLGVSLGFPVMIFAVGFGAMGLFTAVPSMHHALKIVGSLYMLWLAWQIASDSGDGEGELRAKPITLVQSMLFQWLNPKAWVIIAGAVPTFTTPGGDLLGEIATIAIVFGIVSAPCVALWTGFGVVIGRWLDDARKRRMFNWAMAALLVLSIATVFI